MEVFEAKKLWREIAKYTTPTDFSFELEIHHKLLNIFHIGDFYYYIFNCSTAKMELVSDSVRKVLGYYTGDFTVENIMAVMHPEDLPYFLTFERKVTEFFTALPAEKVMKYKVSYDFRLKRANGHYVRLLHQVAPIQTDQNGAVLRVLAVHTDITKMKKENGSTLSFIGLDGEPSYYDVEIGRVVQENKGALLTRREKEILKHLLDGKTSKQIADLLFITKLTVDRHRKNMLKKTNSSSTSQLMIKSIQESWC